MANVQTGRIDIDVAARHAQVIGDGPRYAPLDPDGMPDEAMQMIRDVRAMFNIPMDQHIPEVSLITLRHPGLFRAQMLLGIEVAGKSTIPDRERELAVLRIALLCRAPFEWAEHVLIGKRFGVTPEEIERVIEGSSAPGWTEHEAAILRGCEELIGDHCLSDATWNTLAKSWGEKEMLEFPMLVGSYLMTALQQNSLRVPMEPGKTGLSDR